MNGQKEQDFAACAHIQVERFRVEKGGKVFEEQWRCSECGTKFVTLDSLFAGPQQIQIMEPMKTLRDEFAMAAMQGDWAHQDTEESGIWPSNTTLEDLLPRAQLFYCMADAMLKVRK